MSPRRRPPVAARARERPEGPAYEQVEQWSDGAWVVRRLTGAASTKPYRCPGCQQLIAPATPHVVAWPVDGPVHDPSSGGADARRHWHSACWRARDRRGAPR